MKGTVLLTRPITHSIQYRKQGSGPPLVFLHGVFSESALYDGFLRVLAKHYTVLSLDLPFHGNSADIMVDTLDEAVDLVVALCQKLGLRKPIFCGHSAGGFLAVLCAQRMPSAGVVLVDTAGIFKFKSVPEMVAAIGTKSLRREGFRSLQRKGGTSLTIAARALMERRFWSFMGKGLRKNLRTELGKLSCPIVFVWGAEDDLFPVEGAVALAKSRRLPIIVVKGTHAWPIIGPKALAPHLPFRFKPN